MRHAELRLHRGKRVGAACREVKAIEVPPVAAVGDEEQSATVRRKFGLKNRFLPPPCNRLWLRHVAGAIELRNVKGRTVPRHVGVVPGEPGKPAAVWRKTR